MFVGLVATWVWCWVEDFASTPVLVRTPVVVVWFPVEWYQLVSILPPATAHVVLVFWVGKLFVAMVGYVLPIGFPIFGSEKSPKTNEKKLASLAFLSLPHRVALLELLLTATPSQKLRPRTWRL